MKIDSPLGELKPKQKWNKIDNKGTEANAKALYSIFIYLFILISNFILDIYWSQS